MRILPRRLAAALALALALACGPDEPPGTGDSSLVDLPGGSDPELLTDLDLDEEDEEDAWYACGGRIECREIEVPLDYGDPSGETITIALSRARSWPGHAFQGVILVNPGGPGAQGRPFVETMDAKRALGVLQGFDLVGFDPRGLGESALVTCGSGRFPSTAFALGGTDGLIAQFEADGRDCAARLGPLFEHLGSHDVVRDMEVIRRLLGAAQLNFLGASYGTRLGALYAETYPEKTRAIALDGPVQPVADLTALVAVQFDALLEAVAEFFDDCDAAVLDCPPDPQQVVLDLWDHSVRRSSQDLFAGFWKGSFTQQTGREDLADFIYLYWLFPEIWDELIDGVGSSASLPADVVVNQTVHCTDQVLLPPSADEVEGIIQGFMQRAPGFAITALPVAACTGWRVTPNPVQRLTAPSSPPLLLIGGEHDILTPRAFAEEMSASLASSVLVMSGHYGHGAALWGSPCVDDILDRYFDDLELPAAGTSCP